MSNFNGYYNNEVATYSREIINELQNMVSFLFFMNGKKGNSAISVQLLISYPDLTLSLEM